MASAQASAHACPTPGYQPRPLFQAVSSTNIDSGAATASRFGPLAFASARCIYSLTSENLSAFAKQVFAIIIMSSSNNPERADTSDPFLPKYPTSPARPASRFRIFYCAAVFTLASWAAISLLPTTDSTGTIAYSNVTVSPIQLDAENWTLAPPPQPLSPLALANTCGAVHHHSHGHHPYYYVDPTFIDPAPEGCKTLTYVLTPGHGLSETLLEVFTAFSLAQRENRTFHLDDSAWSWGKWSDYFHLPEQASLCERPPPEHQLPCPRSARHLLVAHETRGEVFGHAFVARFERGNKMGIERWREIFMLIKDGAAEFRPVEAVEWRRRTLEPGTSALQVRRGAGMTIKTSAWAKKGRIPSGAYLAEAMEKGRVIMTDDADVYEEPVFRQALPMILGEEAGVVLKGGWTHERFQLLRPKEKVSVGRRLLAELLVAGTADEVICAGGSATCRLLAVLMGWERAIDDEGWVDVDGGFPWRGVSW